MAFLAGIPRWYVVIVLEWPNFDGDSRGLVGYRF